VAFLASPNKAQGIGMPHFCAVAHTAPALDAVIVSEGVTDFLYTTTNGNILDRLGVGSLSNEQFRDVAPELLDFLRIGADHHTFLRRQCAGGGNA
jgi:hypothetical protein